MVNKVFNKRYKILEKVGSGGMANVYKGEDEVLNRVVAIKILHEQFSGDESFVARFKQEAQSAANLTHPNIVNIFDWGKEGESYYIIMEYLNGQNLKDYIADAGHLTWQETCDIGMQVASALSFAHKNDVVHRDIKPHNIIITREGSVKVTDFGIARAGSSNMTQTGAILGTAHYISPEQANGYAADARSDVYSLGIVLYEMLAGSAPFTGDNPVAIAMKHVQENIPSIKETNPNIPETVVKVLNKALAKNPDERYQAALDLKQDLSAAMKGLPVKADIASEQDTIIIKPRTRQVTNRTSARNKRKNKSKVLPVLSLFVVLALVAATLAFITTSSKERVEVPDITGLTLIEAKEKLKADGLSLKVTGREYSETVKKGLIIEQNPEVGSISEKDTAIEVVLSRGIETTIVPNLVGKTKAEAESLLSKEGLDIGQITREESEGTPDIIMSQNPKAGTDAGKDTSIDIVISKEVEKISVPNVIGRSKKNATVILATKSLKASVVEKYDDDIEKGLVISQSPSAAEEVEKNSTITIYVSKGPEVKKVSVPDVNGMSLADATSQIEAAGLKISSSGAGDTVTSQDPAAGTSVDEGSTVSVIIGTVTTEGL